MKRLTRKSLSTDMVWFVDHDNNDMDLEPCEMSYTHNKLAIQKLAEYEDLKEQGRLIILPEDEMIYHIEESETMKWIGNKPIQDIVFKCGWGLGSLEYHLCDLGRKFFFSRKEAEESVKNIRGCHTCYANDMEYDEVDNPCWNCKGDYSKWLPKKP